MPHLIVEYSEDVISDPRALLSSLHDTLAEEESISKERIKTRAVLVKSCVVGDKNQPDQMVHITLKLMPGRDDDTRARMARSLHSIVRRHIQNLAISVTAEVMELDKASYISD